jgi:GntR family transcriptional regulator
MALPIQIDPADATPIYAQVDRAIRVAIATGKMRPGDQLPTVRQLAVDLRVNANTVARVYLGLERDGIVATKRGVGTFINDTPRSAQAPHRDRQLRALADRYLTDAAAIGYAPREAVRLLAQRIKEGD